MRTWGSAAAVIAALRDDAAAVRERLEREGEAAVDALAHAAATPHDEGTLRASIERVEAARRAAAETEAAEQWEDTVVAASDRDAWMVATAAEARRVFACGTAAAAWLEQVVREAIAALPGNACVVAVPAALIGVAEQWRETVAHDVKKTVRLEAADITAGCIARTCDGRVTFDNTIEARERRSRVEWQTALARLYDESVAAAQQEPMEVA